MARVAVVFTGGTIASVADPSAGGNVPALDGAAILARTPGIDAIADVVVVDRGRTPASHFTFPALLDLADAVRAALADPTIDGAVVVQGTDTIDETSFLLDLVLDSPKPVIVTGAMRAASDEGYDGPVNLRDAVTCASASELREQGVCVVLAGSIHPADDVAKTHTSSLNAFTSPDLGPLGWIERGVLTVPRRRGPRRHVDTTVASDRVYLITAVVAMDGSLLDAAVATGAEGIVVAATGGGNTSAPLLEAAERAMAAGIPVVLTTRSVAGRAVAAYAFPGGGATWARSGAILAGTLSGPKAQGRARPRDRRRAGSCRPGGPARRSDRRPRQKGSTTIVSEVGLIVEGRIATLAGDAGFGWVEAIAIEDGRGRRGRLARRGRRSGRAADAADRARPGRGGDPGAERFASPPLRRRDGGDPGRPGWRSECRGRSRSRRRRPRGARRSRRLAGRPGLGCRGLGPLADRRRARPGRAGPASGLLGPRSPQLLGQLGRPRQRWGVGGDARS